MTITFLGTGTSQGIPVIGSTHPVCLSKNPKDKRLRSSILVSNKNTNLVIDCGPDFRAQLLRANPTHLNAILFTHEHADHTAGLDDIRPFCFLQKTDMPLYAHKRVFTSLKQRFEYIFRTENKYPGTPSVVCHEIINNQPFTIDNTTITPINAYHNTLQVFGFRIHDFVYLTDVKTISDAEMEKLKNVDVLVVNALRKTAHHSHFTLLEALNFIARIKPKKAYLTHISHDMGFYDEVSKELPENVFLSYDNLSITL